MNEDRLNSNKNKASVIDPKGADSTEKSKGNLPIYLAIAGNVAIGIVKFVAAAISGSVSMVSEGIHSIVDSGNGILVLVGIRQSRKEADYLHPFGYGKNLYFWTLIVALLIFLLGGCVSIYRGIDYVMAVSNGTAEKISPWINYVVILISMAIEGSSLAVAIRQLNAARGKMGALEFIHKTSDPSLFTVIFEDTAAELGLLFALLGNFLTHVTGIAYFDGAASIVIGLLLCCVSFALLAETKGLLIGEGVDRRTVDKVRDIVEDNSTVMACGRILSMYLGPDSLLFAIDVTFSKSANEEDIQYATDDIEREIRVQIPQTEKVFIEVESPGRVRFQQAEEASWEDTESDKDTQPDLEDANSDSSAKSNAK